MPTYNSILDRTNDAGALIPEEYEQQIFQHVPERSYTMRLGRRLRDMAHHEKELRVTDGLVTAYFVGATTAVSGDSARIQTSDMSWANKTLRAAKLACIVPIPRDVLEDVTDYDVFGEMRPHIEEAIGIAFDNAVLFGTNAPNDWPTAIEAGATATTVSAASFPDLYDALLGSTGGLGLIEAKGYTATGHLANPAFKSAIRGVRDSNGNPIFVSDPSMPGRYTLDGETIEFAKTGIMTGKTSTTGSATIKCIGGDWSQMVWALRKGITYEVLKEASIFDGSGTLVYSLAQDDLVALKVTFRAGWQIANPPNRDDASTQYPFYVLTA